MARQLGSSISDPAARFSTRLREWFGGAVFTTPTAKAKETRSKSSVYGWVAELHEAGLLTKQQRQRGSQAAEWQLPEDATDPSTAAVLPQVEMVCS